MVCWRTDLSSRRVPPRPPGRRASRGRKRSPWDTRASRGPACAPRRAESPPRRPPAFGMRPVSPELTGQRLGDPEVVGCGDLEVVWRIRNQLHRESGPLADLGIVTWRAAVGGCTELRIGVAQHLPRKALRRLRAPDALTIHGAGDARGRPVAALPDFLE